MLQRALVWLLVALALALTAFGVLHERLWLETGWSAAGLASAAVYLLLFAAFSLVILLWRPQWYGASVAALGLLSSFVMAGPRPVLAVLYIALSAYCLGRIILPIAERPTATTHILTLLTGCVCYLAWFLLTLSLPIHYWWLYLALLALPVYLTFHFGRFPLLHAPRGAFERARAWPLALLWLPLLAQWLLALKPEVSEEGLARHLVFAARLAADHAWHYDVQQFTWAVFPMGGESLFGLAYLLGGEMAARLLNFLLLALACWMVYARLHRRVPAWVAAALTGGFAAAPVTLLRTGSLAVENWIIVFAMGAVLLLRLHKKEGRRMYAYAAAALAGATCACGIVGFAFLLPFFVGFASMTSSAVWMPGAALALVLALAPYLNATFQTANPFFPYFNNFFRSQFYDSLRAVRLTPFHEPFTWRSLYDLTFRADRYGSGGKASYGFATFLLLPIALASVKRRWPRTGIILIGVVVTATLAILLIAPELTNLYPMLPLTVLLAGYAIGSHRLQSPLLGRTLGFVALLAYTLNLLVLPSAGSLHDDFVMPPFVASARDRYLAVHAPERRLIEPLARRSGSPAAAGTESPQNQQSGSPAAGGMGNGQSGPPAVALLESARAGDYAGRVYTNSWHTPAYPKRLYEASNVDSLVALAKELKLGYFVTCTESATRHQTVVAGREFLDRYTQTTARFGDAELHRFTPPESGDLPPDQGWAQPGRHDDLDPAIHFEGQWAREINEPRAWRGTYVHTNDLRARLEIRFQGRAIRLIHASAANRCLTTVSFGYVDARDWDEYSDRTRWQSESPLFEAPAPGNNTLVLHIATPDTSLSNLGACHLDLDAFVVE
jgi:hypothetical protein